MLLNKNDKTEAFLSIIDISLVIFQLTTLILLISINLLGLMSSKINDIIWFTLILAHITMLILSIFLTLIYGIKNHIDQSFL